MTIPSAIAYYWLIQQPNGKAREYTSWILMSFQQYCQVESRHFQYNTGLVFVNVVNNPFGVQHVKYIPAIR